jgi:hypothetical protein
MVFPSQGHVSRPYRGGGAIETGGEERAEDERLSQLFPPRNTRERARAETQSYKTETQRKGQGKPWQRRRTQLFAGSLAKTPRCRALGNLSRLEAIATTPSLIMIPLGAVLSK